VPIAGKNSKGKHNAGAVVEVSIISTDLPDETGRTYAIATAERIKAGD
jgi:hypothetical protein